MIGLMGVWVVAALAGDAAHVEATRLCAADYKHWQEEVNQAVGELPVLAHLLACDSMGVANRALELLIRSKNLKEIRGQLRMLTKNADEGTRLRAAQVLMYMPLHDDLMPMLLEAAARKKEAAIDALTHPASPDLLDTYKQLAQSAGRASQRSGLVALRQLDPCLALVYFLGTPDVADADKYPLFCDFLKAIDLCSDAAMIDLALESLEQNPISDLTFFTFTRGMNQARTEKSGACSPSFEMPPEYVPQPDAPSTWICAQPTPKPDRVVASCMAPPHSGWDCEEPMYSACSAFFETDFEALAQRLHQRLVDRVNATQQTNLRRILHIVDEIPWRCSDMLHNRLGYGQMLCDHFRDEEATDEQRAYDIAQGIEDGCKSGLWMDLGWLLSTCPRDAEAQEVLFAQLDTSREDQATPEGCKSLEVSLKAIYRRDRLRYPEYERLCPDSAKKLYA